MPRRITVATTSLRQSAGKPTVEMNLAAAARLLVRAAAAEPDSEPVSARCRAVAPAPREPERAKHTKGERDSQAEFR